MLESTTQLEPEKEHVQLTRKPNVYAHAGDLGDIVSSLPAIRQLGGGTYILRPHPFRSGGPREPMTRKRAEFILPLLRAQSYITDARYEDSPEGVTHDFADLRITTYKRDQEDSLAVWHARHLGIAEGTLDTSPWLRADPLGDFVGKIIVARSLRYQNHTFPWMKIFQRNKGNCIFLGTRDEHHLMITRAGGGLRWVQVQDAYHMAQIVASGVRFFGNQSFPLWLALGLGKDLVAECWKHSPDVRIQRVNAKYILGPQQNPDFYRQLQ